MNYEKKVMEMTYTILMKKDFVWTSQFSPEMRTQLLNLLLEYFTDIEHYEKCANIVKLQNKSLEIMNGNISKANITGSSIR
jgi:hypothetical protein